MSRCISPVYVRQEKGHIFAPCGRCIECLRTKQGDWTFRLNKELRNALTAYFVTLTYNDEYLPKDKCLSKSDLQNYIKRLRKLNDIKLKYYGVGEYGGDTKRPHYHLILFNVNDVNSISKAWCLEGKQLGFVKVGTVTSDSINYVTKYIITKNSTGMAVPPFALMSKKLGILYLRENWKWHKSGLKNYVLENGYKKHMPRYYRDKVFNFHEKQKIANDLIKEIDQKENEQLEKYKDTGEYFQDKLNAREQKVNNIIKKSKKNKL